MQRSTLTTIGGWRPGATPPAFEPAELVSAAARIREPIHVVRESPAGRLGVAFGGETTAGSAADGSYPLLATLAALYPEWLGDRSFLEVHGVRFPYVAGAMANGIATPALVVAMARAGMIGFFGAAGLTPERVERSLEEIQTSLGDGDLAWGSNLIHSPNEPELEQTLVEMYLRRGVRRVSASAYMRLTPAVVRYAISGIRADPQGRVLRQNMLFAKISRPEVAQRFLSPAPAPILDSLVASGMLTREEARLATRIPLAEDVTVESDSGGHTDNRPLAALFPTISALRDEIVTQQGYERPVRVGAAGGLGTPSAVAAAFSLGAAYVLTGSVNQAAVESGLSEDGKQMLAEAGIADVVMAPAADMFELGVKVQVLKRGSLFGVRALKLYEAYRSFDAIESIPAATRERLEREVLGASMEDIWTETRAFLRTAQPAGDRAGRAGPEAPHGSGVPLVPGQVEPLGDRGRVEAPLRLPDLVRPRDGRLQRLGAGVVPRGPRSAKRRPDRPQPARGSGRGEPRATAPQLRCPHARRSLQLPPQAARLSRRAERAEQTPRPRKRASNRLEFPSIPGRWPSGHRAVILRAQTRELPSPGRSRWIDSSEPECAAQEG